MSETVGYVNRARAFMPPGTVPPFITRFDAGSVAVGQLIFSSPTRTQGELQDFALNRVRPLFATLPGVSAPPPFGGNQRTIVITLNPDKLQQYGISPDEAVAAVSKASLVMPSGNIVDRQRSTASPAPTPRWAATCRNCSSTPIRPGSGTTRVPARHRNHRKRHRYHHRLRSRQRPPHRLHSRHQARRRFHPVGDQCRQGGHPGLQESRARRCRCPPGIRPIAIRPQFDSRPGRRRVCSAPRSPA